jgi:hypothetical protein
MRVRVHIIKSHVWRGRGGGSIRVMADVFDTFFQTLPKERKFSISDIPSNKVEEFQGFLQDQQLLDSGDFDAKGAFLAGMTRGSQGHFGSIGLGGKMLKSPRHETAWKTAFVEIIRDLGLRGAPGPEDFPDRGAASLFIENLMMGEAAF